MSVLWVRAAPGAWQPPRSRVAPGARTVPSRGGDEPGGQGSGSGQCPTLLPAARHRKQPCRRERERKNPLRDLQGTNGAKNKP